MPDIATPLILGTLGVVGAGAAAGANYGLTKAARKENYMYNEMAADNAFERQTQMQKYLQELQYKQFYDLESPKAVIQQLKDAGLSPSIFAQGGVGGNVSGVSTSGSAPQGSGAAGINYPSVTPMDFASINLATAQAEKAHEEANALRGTNPQGEANVADTLASAGLKDAQAQLTKATKVMQDIENEIAASTKESQIKEIQYNAQSAEYHCYKAYNDAANSSLEFQWNKETYNERIKQCNAKTSQLIADAYEKFTHSKLNEEEKAKVIAETEKIYNELFYFNEIDLQSAKAYQEWYYKQAETLPERLELMSKELGLQKTKMWLNFATDSAKAIGTGLGMYFFGKKGGKAPVFNEKPFELNTPMQQFNNPPLKVYY